MKNWHRWLVVLFLVAGGIVVAVDRLSPDSHTGSASSTTSQAPARPTRPAARPVRIGYQKLSIYAPVFIAKERGLFRKHGVDVELVPFTSANQMMNGVIAGQLEGTGLTNLQVAMSVEAKDPGKTSFINFLVWTPESHADYFLARAGSGIKTVKDVEGKTVGVHPGSAVKAFALTLLKMAGANTEKTTVLELEPSVMASALAARRVDALYCMDPVATKLITAQQAQILVSNPMSRIVDPPVPISGTLLATSFVKARGDEARGVEAALNDAIEFTRDRANDSERARIVAKYTGASEDDIRRERTPAYWKRSEIDRVSVRRLAARFRDLGIAPGKVDVEGMIME